MSEQPTINARPTNEQPRGEQPTAELLSQLDLLGLATADQVASVRSRVRKLAGSLPWFDSVWVDALRQAKLLTAYQASELCAGRGDKLRAGPFVILQPLGQCHYARVYEAREIATRRVVRLLVGELGQQHDLAAVQRQMQRLIETSTHLQNTSLLPVIDSGIDESTKPYRLWAIAEPATGVSAAEWMISSGRFPPEAVLEIARQMAAALAELEQLELVHSDLCTAGLLIDKEGQTRLPHAGVRAIVRPEEGYGSAELVPAAYDNVAPERVVEGTGPTIASDIYGCGSVWWQLLTGRGPLGGGDSLSRLQAAHRGKIVDVCRLAPETPAPLAEAIRRCTQSDVTQRPRSFAELVELLGKPTDEGRASLATCIEQTSRPSIFRDLAKQPVSLARQAKPWVAATAGGLVVSAIAWTLWQTPWQQPLANTDTSRDVSQTAAANEVPAVAGERATQIDHNVMLAAHSDETSDFGQGHFEQGEMASQVAGAHVRAAAHGEMQEDVLLLPADRVVRLAELSLRPGQIVRGMSGGRPRIEIPTGGLSINVDDVRFERCDFVAVDDGTTPASPTAEAGAIVVLQCQRVAFNGCTFQANTTQPRAAIRWNSGAGQGTSIGPSDQLLLMSNCLLRGTTAGVAMKSAANRTLELHNTLVLGPGPLVLVDGCPRLDEPLALNLFHVTLRGATSLVEVRYEAIHDEPGRITVYAENSVFAAADGGALFFCDGLPSPSRLLERIEWTGEGSLLAEEAIVAAWLSDTATPMLVDDTQLAIDGLARSRFTFAGSDMGDAESSQIVDWSAPRATKTPPGIRRQVVSRIKID